MDTTDQNADEVVETGADQPADQPAARAGAGTASDLYDASNPPFGALPEKPPRAPAPALAPPSEASPSTGRRAALVRAGLPAAASLLAVVLLRRRRSGARRGGGPR